MMVHLKSSSRYAGAAQLAHLPVRFPDRPVIQPIGGPASGFWRRSGGLDDGERGLALHGAIRDAGKGGFEIHNAACPAGSNGTHARLRAGLAMILEQIAA